MCNTTRRTLRNKRSEAVQIQLYKGMAVRMLTYGSEIWNITRKYETKRETAEVKFLGSVAGCTGEDETRNTKS
jgi:hypothetical protein